MIKLAPTTITTFHAAALVCSHSLDPRSLSGKQRIVLEHRSTSDMSKYRRVPEFGVMTGRLLMPHADGHDIYTVNER